MNIEFKEKIKLFSQLQKDNILALQAIYIVFKIHIVSSILFFSLSTFCWLFLDIYVPAFFSDLVPKIYRGKLLILESSSFEFYKFSGFVYLICTIFMILFFIVYLYALRGFSVKLRRNKYDLKENILYIFILILIMHHLVSFFVGPIDIDRLGIISSAVYRGEYFLGIFIPLISIPLSLLALFSITVLQFFVLSKRHSQERKLS